MGVDGGDQRVPVPGEGGYWMNSGIIQPKNNGWLFEQARLRLQISINLLAGVCRFFEGRIHFVDHDHGQRGVAPVIATELIFGSCCGNRVERVRSIEISNLLLDSVFGDLEVILGEIGHESIGFIGDNDVQNDKLTLHCQRRGGTILRGDRGTQSGYDPSHSGEEEKQAPTCGSPKVEGDPEGCGVGSAGGNAHIKV